MRLSEKQQKLLDSATKKGSLTKLEADNLLGANAIEELRELTSAGLLTRPLPGLYKPQAHQLGQMKMF